MSALKILLVDDEALARSRLRALLGDCTEPASVVAAEAGDAVQAMRALQHQSFDAVLLDIHMPGADGLALAGLIARLPRPPAVVFVTAHAGHAVQAFELDAVDYLTKPVRLERLRQALQKVERTMQASIAQEPEKVQETLLIQDRGRTERVPIGEVLFFKAELKYITVRTAGRSYILDGSLSELEERFGSRFMRIHRNALIARGAVRALEKHFDPEEGEGWAVRLNGLEELLAVSRRQLGAVRDAIAS
ncbi:LytR/AlgR family response regulator transcription factor [Polaromonas glacialis]|uniref:LytR/AlgR family response regulator transcription factor n=1 Tax=Polaromonas glacialis TaxID=866564 RepID=UPI0004968B26|nr:LytTR family DNA-binding domain-containing protein [Polaromonas glacialis]